MKCALPLILLAGLSLQGCVSTRTDYSAVMHEPARVERKEYHGMWMQPVPMGKTTTYITHPARHIVHFSGKISFSINDRELYNRMSEGDSVDIAYREKYKTRLEDIDGDGRKEAVTQSFKGCDFLQAVKK
ncbi:MAG: hypothetical protein V1725_03230 [archaeon]